MITLNRPYQVKKETNVLHINTLYERRITWLYTTREGLDWIYKKLYRDRGPLRVAVSPLTCFVALYPIIQNGHSIVFVDIDENTLNMSVDQLCAQEQVDVVQVIYLGGNPMPMDMIQQWAKARNIIIVEDCAQALGSMYNNKPVGVYGDYAVYSAVKNLYTKMGGILLSTNEIQLSNSTTTSNLLDMYKSVKWWLEKHTNSHCLNPINYIYDCLLHLRKKHEDNETKLHVLKPKQKESILKALALHKDIQTKRAENAKQLISMIDQKKYAIQQETQGGTSNRNRIMLIAKNRKAKDIILDLRKYGIAANNLTQSYISPYQEIVINNDILSEYYTQKLEVYERVLPYIITIPSSPALTAKEIEYIAKYVNLLG